MTKLLVTGLGVWLLLMITAVINAGARENIYGPHMSDLRAHQLSTVTLSLMIFTITYIFIQRGNYDLTGSAYLLLGVLWLSLTVVFEFVAGHFVFGNTWEKIFADYNVFNGRIWVLILLSTLLAPWIVSRLVEA